MARERQPEIPAGTIVRHTYALYPSLAMLAGMQLDLFTPLKDGPMTGAELAGVLGVRREKLLPLLYALVSAELLTVREEHFANTPEADRYLVRGRPDYVGSAHELYADIWAALLKTAQSIRTGVPQARHDFSAMSDDELWSFFRGLHAATLAAGRDLARLFDFGRFRRLIDVGGGSGGVAIAACQAHPDLMATIADLPRVVPIARAFVEEAGLAGRIDVVAANVVAVPPEGRYDAAVLRSFIQVLSPDEAQRALAHVGQALEPGGSIFIVGRILHDSRLSPPETVAFNLVCLNIYDGGQAYTHAEHRAWLDAAGFRDVEIHEGLLPAGAAVVTARKRS
jgi:2-hydroxy-4-(methylsulfanyl)butanoate S-methyltransferase